MTRLLARLSLAALLSGAALSLAQDAPKQVKAVDDHTAANRTKRIILVGDSTMNHSSGWSGGFCDDLAGDVECFNMARNGRSSLSYRTEGFWDRAMALATKPGYILISFGANDQPGKGPERETDPKTTFYANMKRYVEAARAAGITPILVTPAPSRKFTGGKYVPDIGPYAEAIRKVAADTSTPLIDLYARAAAYYGTLTQAQADEFDKQYPGHPEIVDRAHMNRKGAALLGGFVAEELAKAVPGLAKSVSVEP